MTTQVTATVINGMLKPDQALPLREQARVKLTIEPLVEQLDPMEAWQSLKAWIKQNPLHGLGRHLTRDQLHERR
jgi:predicted DNA-binding antitoxin AbrB/MazE fold protein